MLIETIAQMRTEMATLLGLEGDGTGTGTGTGGEPVAAGLPVASSSPAAASSGVAAAGSMPPLPPPPSAGVVAPATTGAPGGAVEGQYGSTGGTDTDYFASYAKLTIHEDMLGDRVR